MIEEEFLEIVDINGNPIRIAPRSEVHGNPELLHKVVHVLVFHENGELLLQKRSMQKDVAPGKWDTSVGGHVAPEEDLILAAKREMEEELGITSDDMRPLYSYTHSNAHESELVYSYRCLHNGPFPFDRKEVDDVRFWHIDEIQEKLGEGIFSHNFESEFMQYLTLCAQAGAIGDPALP